MNIYKPAAATTTTTTNTTITTAAATAATITTCVIIRFDQGPKSVTLTWNNYSDPFNKYVGEVAVVAANDASLFIVRWYEDRS
jgi:hypothetical protein